MLTSVIAAGMVQALRLGQIRLARRKACSPLRRRVTRIINHRYSLAALRRRASRSKGLSRNPRFPRPELIFSGETARNERPDPGCRGKRGALFWDDCQSVRETQREKRLITRTCFCNG